MSLDDETPPTTAPAKNSTIGREHPERAEQEPEDGGGDDPARPAAGPATGPGVAAGRRWPYCGPYWAGAYCGWP